MDKKMWNLQVDQLARVVTDLDDSDRVVVRDPGHLICAQVVHLEVKYQQIFHTYDMMGEKANIKGN